MGIKDERADRLAAALRANLRRRKTQARDASGAQPGAVGEGGTDGEVDGLRADGEEGEHRGAD